MEDQMHVLEQISEGMKVIDSRNKEIGTVDYVKLVDEDETGEPLAADVGEADKPRHTILSDIAEAFRTDDVPEVIQQRLLHDGFVRMDAKGIGASDRYVLPDQISAVSGDKVMLNVSKDELVKRH
jgi:hypothetical protein